MDVFFLLLAVILWEHHEKPRRSYRKKYIEEIVWETSLHTLLPISFFRHFFCLVPPFRLLQFYIENFFISPEIGREEGDWHPLASCLRPWNYINIKTTHPFLLLLFLQISFFWFLRVHFMFLFRLKNWIMYHVIFISVFRTRCWELFCKTAVWQDITKIFNFFCKIFHYSLLNKKVYKFIKNKILDRCFSRAMVKRSILQLATQNNYFPCTVVNGYF